MDISRAIHFHRKTLQCRYIHVIKTLTGQAALANYHRLSTRRQTLAKLVSNSPQILITLPHGEICKLPENANSAFGKREKSGCCFFSLSVKPKIRRRNIPGQKSVAGRGGGRPFFIPRAHPSCCFASEIALCYLSGSDTGTRSPCET